jgi:hypothetical protein
MKFQLSQKAAKNRLHTSSSIQLATFIKNTKMMIGLGISVPNPMVRVPMPLLITTANI